MTIGDSSSGADDESSSFEYIGGGEGDGELAPPMDSECRRCLTWGSFGMCMGELLG